jgi:hypothetical protein
MKNAGQIVIEYINIKTALGAIKDPSRRRHVLQSAYYALHELLDILDGEIGAYKIIEQVNHLISKFEHESSESFKEGALHALRWVLGEEETAPSDM